MGIYGYDLSNHQPTPDLNGWDFVFAKASEGSWFQDGRFWEHMTNAANAGCLRGAYHFLRSDAPIVDQVETFKSVVPLNIPAIPDVESYTFGGRVISAPTLDQTREFVNRLRDAGYHVPLMYLPRWYWQQWGSPQDISDLPPLWLSRYPDYVARPREEALSLVPDWAKQPFGGIASAPIIQFTSTPLDQNYFDGSKDELAALLGGDDMSWSEDLTLTNPDGSTETHQAREWFVHMARRIARLEVELDKYTTTKNYKGEEVLTEDVISATEGKLDALIAKVDRLSTGTGYTLDEIVKAVNDDAARRLAQ